MANEPNEPTGDKPVQNSSEKPVARRPRHRSGRSGRPQGDSAERKASAQLGNSTERKSVPSPGTPSERKSAPRQNNGPDRKYIPQQENRAERKSPSRWTLRDYLLQLSVVIVGIMVTFIGSDLISSWSHSREVKAAMQLVVSELKVNRTKVDRVCRSLIKDRHGMLMFMNYRFNTELIPDDSLLYYSNPHIIGSSVEVILQSDALEVLKSSGLITSIEDKEQLLCVLRSYNRLESFCESLDSYNAQKMKGLDHLFSAMTKSQREHFSIGGDDYRGSWKIILDDPLCMCFLGFSAYFFGDDESLLNEVSTLDETITSIKKKYTLE